MREIPCLPLIQERFWNAIKDQEICKDTKYPEFEMYMFPQVWSSTALGFGGFGGQAMTSAYTTVIVEQWLNIWGVFFSERLAYSIQDPNDLFFEDFKEQRMAERGQASKYIRMK